jgi:hypothetical protein
VRKSGRSPFDYLGHRQAGDGHYRYSAASDQTPVWVTAQALLAVNRGALPLAPVARAGRGSGGGGGAGESDAAGGGGASNPAPSSSRDAGAPGDAAIPGAAEGGRAPTHANAGGGAGQRVSALPLSAPVSDADESQGDAGGTSAIYVAGGLAALAAALALGFLWYRRRLP